MQTSSGTSVLYSIEERLPQLGEYIKIISGSDAWVIYKILDSIKLPAIGALKPMYMGVVKVGSEAHAIASPGKLVRILWANGDVRYEVVSKLEGMMSVGE